MIKKTLGFLRKLVVTYFLVATFHSITYDFAGVTIFTITWIVILLFALKVVWRPK